MSGTPVAPIRPENTAKGDAFLTAAVAVSIAIAIFAVVTQCLAATGAISLSTTQQLTMWLVAAGLLVLLWIAYMAVTAQARMAEAVVAATAAAEREAAAARDDARVQVAEANRAAEERVAAAQRERDHTVAIAESRAAEAESRDAWVPPDKLRLLDGSARSVTNADVFPDGCYLDSISEVQDYGEETGTGGEVVVFNRPRGQMYRCVVVDLNRARKDQPHDAVVNILADQEPSLPPGHPSVEFDGLTITPYVTDRSPVRIGYALRATGIRLAAGQAQQAS
jgi:hypothetical protein